MLAAMGNVFSWLWQLEMSEAKALIILFRTTSQAVFCVRQNILATLWGSLLLGRTNTRSCNSYPRNCLLLTKCYYLPTLMLYSGKHSSLLSQTQGAAKVDNVGTDLGRAGDIIQAVERLVPLLPRANKFQYGTVGGGLDCFRMVWPQEAHLFSSQAQAASSALPHRPSVEELAPPGRVKKTILRKHKLDALFIDLDGASHWLRWVTAAAPTQQPQVIAIMAPSMNLIKEPAASASTLERKQMARMGYRCQTWFLQAKDYGGAISQDRTAVVYFKGPSHVVMTKPTCDGLPARSMSNLLLPTGVPTKSWAKQRPRRAHPSESIKSLPCTVDEMLGTKPVFSGSGLMPDQTNAWIRTHNGVRQLQASELAKGLGVPSEWMKGGTPLQGRQVARNTCVHLWAAVGDSVATFLSAVLAEKEVPGHISDPGSLESPGSMSGKSDPVDDDVEWEWELPDLSAEGVWYNARVESLRKAVEGLPEPEKLIAEGLEALIVHRGNHTSEGPKRLQLLWWEFPPEHWEGLRCGSSMHFLITPSGELVLNSPMEEADIVIAAKFVDELILLGTLRPAEEVLLANCPLFLVDKLGPDMLKRCIADMKNGGQNACIGKDPLFLPRAGDILPQLYAGGWTAIADASKHFHNFPTHPDEHQYLGCMHPRTNAPYVWFGLPMGSANSPAIACRIGNGSLRMLRDKYPLFQGTPMENSWRQSLSSNVYDVRLGHGRVLIGDDGLPAALVFGHVDDYFIHGPTKAKC